MMIITPKGARVVPCGITDGQARRI